MGDGWHIVQRAIDLDAELWGGRRRVLAGRSMRLEDRPYALTLAAAG